MCVIVPFGRGVCTSARAAGADGDRGNAHCDRHICIGAARREVRCAADCPRCLLRDAHEGRICIECAAGTTAKLLDMRRERCAAVGAFTVQRLFHAMHCQTHRPFEIVQHAVAQAPHVDVQPSLARNAVDALTPADASDGEGGARLSRQEDTLQRVRQRGCGVYRIHHTEVGPAVTTIAAEGDTPAGAAQRRLHDTIVAGAVDRDHGVRNRCRIAHQLFHSAQVAQAFLAHRTSQHDLARGLQIGGVQRVGNGEQRRETASVVTDPRALQTMFVLRDHRRGIVEYRVEVRAGPYGARDGGGGVCGSTGDQVARDIGPLITPPQDREPLRHPGSPHRFVPRRRCNTRHVTLPGQHPRIVPREMFAGGFQRRVCDAQQTQGGGKSGGHPYGS